MISSTYSNAYLWVYCEYMIYETMIKKKTGQLTSKALHLQGCRFKTKKRSSFSSVFKVQARLGDSLLTWKKANENLKHLYLKK